MKHSLPFFSSIKARCAAAVRDIYSGFILPRRRELALLLVCTVLTLALGRAAGTHGQALTPDTTLPSPDISAPAAQSDAPEATQTDTPGASQNDTPDDADTPPHDTAYHFDENGMLLYDTYGHYVQADSYADSAQIPWQLLLVNDWNPMPAGYDDALTLSSFGSQQTDSRMEEALTRMLADGSEHGLALVSGFRSADLQHTLYWNKVEKYRTQGYNELDAQLLGGTVVKRPGFSEHNTGLAADLGGSGNFSLERDFADTQAYAWLIDHCADYGFILRFPEGKEDVTGVIFEPWHYRYVGVEAAREIMTDGLCLEEYLEQLGQ